MPRVPFLRVLRKTGHGGTALCPRWVQPGRFTCPTPAGSWVGAGCPRRPLVPAAPRGRPPRSSRQGTQAGGEPAGPRQQEPPLGGRAADFPQRTWDRALRTSGTECPSTPLTAPVLTGAPGRGHREDSASSCEQRAQDGAGRTGGPAETSRCDGRSRRPAPRLRAVVCTPRRPRGAGEPGGVGSTEAGAAQRTPPPPREHPSPRQAQAACSVLFTR